MDTENIRNFCIIAHIDHGKSTLADRILETTGTVDPRNMTAQFLDQMDLEKERGITIKGKAVRMTFHENGEVYQLNLIDTPGHVDFGYEVSRALAACEGAILVVDASQGIQAQTLANAYLALGHDLMILPVLNKIDLPFADPERIGSEMVQLFGFDSDEIVLTSAKEGIGISDVLSSIVKNIPPPKGDPKEPLKALIFDSSYDPYKGVIAYVRIFQGSIASGTRIKMMGSNSEVDAIEVGVFRPNLEDTGMLTAGEVGYIATGLKTVRECRVGDTITTSSNGSYEELPGYNPQKLVVFAGLYPSEGESYQSLREALEKLQLNDAALSFEPENSQALGFGFRCGFLGPLHMEIVQERLEREYNLELIATSPSVAYKAIAQNGEELTIANPSEMPHPGQLNKILEPWLLATIITPSRYIGSIMELMTNKRGNYKRIEYLTQVNAQGDSSDPAYDARVLLEFELPLAELIIDFYDQIKTRSQGYASLDYDMIDYKEGALVKLDVMLNGKVVDALSFIVHKDKSYALGRNLVNKLKDVIPRQMFEVAIQAALGSRIIARETIRPLRKNVLAKCYGGDITRKRKLLEKQAEGKKRLKTVGQVEVPQEAFLALLNNQK
ncbi:MAG: elongation factor 4 [Chloroflexi bacterium]|nr:elongation factor 4 [Chloroflexota bacterium]|tara:strand:+ start:2354 stop:4189 length:1836 start_codon:yes stop_codon:yes gene_type:complete